MECVCLQYPGRGPRLREKSHIRIEDLVEEIESDFNQWQDKPFAFYGHSFGGIVAFELARRLCQPGLRGPFHLFAGAARPPHVELPFPPIHGLPDPEFLEQVQARYGGIPAAVLAEPELLELMVPALRADFIAYETYEYTPGDPLRIPITVFGGEEDRVVTVEMLKQWALHTSESFDISVLHDGHFFNGLSAQELARKLRLSLSEYSS